MSSVIERLFQKADAIKFLKSSFENLKDGTFNVTSTWDAKYNCIAHAAEENHRKWWPIAQEHALNDRYWPKVTRRETVRAFTLAFQTLGYEPCESAEYEEGYEKVAIYVSEVGTPELAKGAPTHMARQLPCGKWTSKLGDAWDICHDTLDRVAGKQYGKVKRILRRELELRIVDIDYEQAKSGREKAGDATN